MMAQISLMFFCLGNICRSPLAEGIFRELVIERGVADRFEIASSGTGGWHAGEPPDPGSVAVAKLHGLDISHQRAQQLTAAHLKRYDVLVAMGRPNVEAARKLHGGHKREILLMRDFEPLPSNRGLDVPDPWGKSEAAFEEVYQILHRAMPRLLDHLLER